jgi:transcriptional regulator with XRE-family HTH domain
MTDPEGALAWRKAAGLSRAKVAELTGFSPSAIACIERGAWSSGEPIAEKTHRSYRLAIIAIAARLDWLTWQDLERMEASQ